MDTFLLEVYPKKLLGVHLQIPRNSLGTFPNHKSFNCEFCAHLDIVRLCVNLYM